VYYIQWWRHYLESEKAGNKYASAVSNFFWPPPMHKVHLCVPVGPSPLWASLPASGPYTSVWPSTPVFYNFYYYMGPFHPREVPPVGGFWGWSAPALAVVKWFKWRTVYKQRRSHRCWAWLRHIHSVVRNVPRYTYTLRTRTFRSSCTCDCWFPVRQQINIRHTVNHTALY